MAAIYPERKGGEWTEESLNKYYNFYNRDNCCAICESRTHTIGACPELPMPDEGDAGEGYEEGQYDEEQYDEE